MCQVEPQLGSTVFKLPAGYASAGQSVFPTAEGLGNGQVAYIAVLSNGAVFYAPGSQPAGAGGPIQLDGIDFRCSPSGSNGCP